jgi:hypothetical protein
MKTAEDKQRERMSNNLQRIENYFKEAKRMPCTGAGKNLRFEAMCICLTAAKLFVHAGT